MCLYMYVWGKLRIDDKIVVPPNAPLRSIQALERIPIKPREFMIPSESRIKTRASWLRISRQHYRFPLFTLLDCRTTLTSMPVTHSASNMSTHLPSCVPPVPILAFLFLLLPIQQDLVPIPLEHPSTRNPAHHRAPAQTPPDTSHNTVL